MLAAGSDASQSHRRKNNRSTSATGIGSNGRCFGCRISLSNSSDACNSSSCSFAGHGEALRLRQLEFEF